MLVAASKIYVDANGTYPVPAGHYDAVASRLKEVDGNPSSIHAPGRNAKIALEEARTSIARMLGALPTDLVFTSGATEANNLALHGVVGRLHGGSLPHLIVTATEHAAVLEPARLLALRGLCSLSIAPVNAHGVVDTDALLAMITSDTALVAVIAANNETGTLNPIRELAAQIKAQHAHVHVHSDMVQLLGKDDLTWLAKSPLDSAAFSAHKLGAFKGIGALYLKRGVKLQAFLTGGGQERGRRPGTENMPGIVSFGLRCEEARGTETSVAFHLRSLRDAWLAELATIPSAVVHAAPAESLPNTVNFHVEGVAGDDILLNFDLAGIHASSGSACSSSVARPSHVLLAMGYSEWVALNSVRVSFSAENSLTDVTKMADVLKQVIARLI